MPDRVLSLGDPMAVKRDGDDIYPDFVTIARGYRVQAERVTTFLADLLTTADDPSIDQRSVLRLLEPAVARAEDELAADPASIGDDIHGASMDDPETP